CGFQRADVVRHDDGSPSSYFITTEGSDVCADRWLEYCRQSADWKLSLNADWSQIQCDWESQFRIGNWRSKPLDGILCLQGSGNSCSSDRSTFSICAHVCSQTLCSPAR